MCKHTRTHTYTHAHTHMHAPSTLKYDMLFTAQTIFHLDRETFRVHSPKTPDYGKTGITQPFTITSAETSLPQLEYKARELESRATVIVCATREDSCWEPSDPAQTHDPCEVTDARPRRKHTKSSHRPSERSRRHQGAHPSARQPAQASQPAVGRWRDSSQKLREHGTDPRDKVHPESTCTFPSPEGGPQTSSERGALNPRVRPADSLNRTLPLSRVLSSVSQRPRRESSSPCWRHLPGRPQGPEEARPGHIALSGSLSPAGPCGPTQQKPTGGGCAPDRSGSAYKHAHTRIHRTGTHVHAHHTRHRHTRRTGAHTLPAEPGTFPSVLSAARARTGVHRSWL